MLISEKKNEFVSILQTIETYQEECRQNESKLNEKIQKLDDRLTAIKYSDFFLWTAKISALITIGSTVFSKSPYRLHVAILMAMLYYGQNRFLKENAQDKKLATLKKEVLENYVSDIKHYEANLNLIKQLKKKLLEIWEKEKFPMLWDQACPETTKYMKKLEDAKKKVYVLEQ